MEEEDSFLELLLPGCEVDFGEGMFVALDDGSELDELDF
jgi:hypothetical protein